MSSAFIDESVRIREGSGSYLLAAAVVAPLDQDGIRTSMRTLLSGRQPLLHWHTETAKHRQAIVDHVAGLGIHAHVVTCPVRTRGDQERSRARCMRHLVWRLATARHVRNLVIERRSPCQDRLDGDRLRGLRDGRVVPPSVRFDFRHAVEEPLLWIADAVAGACNAAMAGDPQYRERLDHLLTVEPTPER